MAAFNGPDPPATTPANYALGAAKLVAYGHLAQKYKPSCAVEVGKTAVSLLGGVRMGTVLAIEFTKGRPGKRCILKIGRRKYNAALSGCVGVPEKDIFVQDHRGDWYRIMDNKQKKALLKKCLKLVPNAGNKDIRTEQEVDDLFEEDDKEGTLLACLLACCLFVLVCACCCFCCCFCFFLLNLG